MKLLITTRSLLTALDRAGRLGRYAGTSKYYISAIISLNYMTLVRYRCYVKVQSDPIERVALSILRSNLDNNEFYILRARDA